MGQITGRKENKMNELRWYRISADGGETWTSQILTDTEASREREEYGYIVEMEERPV